MRMRRDNIGRDSVIRLMQVLWRRPMTHMFIFTVATPAVLPLSLTRGLFAITKFLVASATC